MLGKIVSAMAAVLIVLLIVVGASPDLHRAIHHDADCDGHHCAITAFAAGEAYSPLAPMGVEPTVVRVEAIVRPAVSVGFARAEYRLLPTCGPPTSGQMV